MISKISSRILQRKKLTKSLNKTPTRLFFFHPNHPKNLENLIWPTFRTLHGSGEQLEMRMEWFFSSKWRDASRFFQSTNLGDPRCRKVYWKRSCQRKKRVRIYYLRSVMFFVMNMAAVGWHLIRGRGRWFFGCFYLWYEKTGPQTREVLKMAASLFWGLMDHRECHWFHQSGWTCRSPLDFCCVLDLKPSLKLTSPLKIGHPKKKLVRIYIYNDILYIYIIYSCNHPFPGANC